MSEKKFVKAKIFFEKGINFYLEGSYKFAENALAILAPIWRIFFDWWLVSLMVIRKFIIHISIEY